MPDLVIGTNSYVDLTLADAHFDARLHADTWTAASDDTKERALLMACWLLDRHIIWTGTKAFPDQPLEWPRIGLPWLPAGIVPPGVKVAQMELALLLISTDTTAPSDMAGTASIELTGAIKIVSCPGDRVQTIPDQIYSYVRAYGYRGTGLGIVKLVRR